MLHARPRKHTPIVKWLARAAFSLFLLAAVFKLAGAQSYAAEPDGFVARSAPLAQEAQRKTGIPASVTLAQAIVESNWGTQPIPGANNYFGIKAFPRADGSINIGQVAIGWVWYGTLEWNGYANVQIMARFRKYKTVGDSFLDHAYFFLENSRYARALEYTAEPQRFAREIALAGYATDPTYANQLIGYMDRLNLYQYDVKPEPPAKPTTTPTPAPKPTPFVPPRAIAR